MYVQIYYICSLKLILNTSTGIFETISKVIIIVLLTGTNTTIVYCPFPKLYPPKTQS